MKLLSFADDYGNSLASCQMLSDESEGCQLECGQCRLALQHLYQIQERLQSDLQACDARLSLFVAAANSYRFETLLQPFPQQFLDSNSRPNIDGVFDVIADIERLEYIMKQLARGNYNCCPQNVLTLLHAVLVRHGERVAISTLPAYKFQDLFNQLKIAVPQRTPTQIFEITPSSRRAHTAAYSSLREQYPRHIAFYAGKLSHLYVMLNEGSMPQDAPLELICNMDEAVKCTPCDAGWGSSSCGALVSCVAIVEFVLMPAQVMLSKDNSRAYIKDSNCMQISHLMFFGQSFAQYERKLAWLKLPSYMQNTKKWLLTNKYAVSLGASLMMLTLTSRSGSGVLHKFATVATYVLRRGLFKF